jgi:hypothetical protein
VKLIDLNLLLYAVNRASPHHARARRWLDAALTADEPIALPWVVLLGFVRITTHPRILERPLSPDTAMSIVDGWLQQPPVRVLNPGPEHWRILTGLLAATGTAGNLTTDAHLAALAIENGCQICSTDHDFARFPRLDWTNPLSG